MLTLKNRKKKGKKKHSKAKRLTQLTVKANKKNHNTLGVLCCLKICFEHHTHILLEIHFNILKD